MEGYEHSYHSWIDYLNDYMMLGPGVMARQLTAENEPMEGTISSRPDIYHTIQAFLIGRVPLWPPIGAALARGLIDKPEGAPIRPGGRRGRSARPLFSWKQDPRGSTQFGE